jgi:hypothetical protein
MPNVGVEGIKCLLKGQYKSRHHSCMAVEVTQHWMKLPFVRMTAVTDDPTAL